MCVRTYARARVCVFGDISFNTNNSKYYIDNNTFWAHTPIRCYDHGGILLREIAGGIEVCGGLEI